VTNWQTSKLNYRTLPFRFALTIGFALTFIAVSNSGCKSGSRVSTLLTSFNPQSLKISQSWHNSYDDAIQESRETGKPVLANFTSSVSCVWCVKLKRDVFETETFAQWASANVVLLNLDFQQPSKLSSEIQQRNQELAAKHGITGYPTVVIIDSQENVLGQLRYMDDAQKWVAKAESFIHPQ
jgi:protein disulfide-isomerase